MKDFKTILSKPHRQEIVERFIRYAAIETTSDPHSQTTPSTECQWDLARLLHKELQEMGIEDVSIDEHAYVIARLPASPGFEKKPAIGFMGHMDTSSDVSGKDVKPQIHEDYDGKPIKLSEGWTLDPNEFTELKSYIGDTIITTDGTTLLGADDKSGVAIVMAAMNWLVKNPSFKHGPVYAIFNPDEEIGRGMDLVPMDRFKDVVCCYTLDGGDAGQVEAECFNAYGVNIKFTGKSAHPGYARGVMANAASMAAHMGAMLPRTESPEATDGWFGYYHITEISGGLEEAKLGLILRDFYEDGMERRIQTVKDIAKAVEASFPGGKVELEFKKQYLNMKKKLDESPKVFNILWKAIENTGMTPYSKPIRGGTDGARLTEMGIPTPNFFCGMHTFHSRYEWASVSEMVLGVETVIETIRLWAEE